MDFDYVPHHPSNHSPEYDNPTWEDILVNVQDNYSLWLISPPNHTSHPIPDRCQQVQLSQPHLVPYSGLGMDYQSSHLRSSDPFRTNQQRSAHHNYSAKSLSPNAHELFNCQHGDSGLHNAAHLSHNGDVPGLFPELPPRSHRLQVRGISASRPAHHCSVQSLRR